MNVSHSLSETIAELNQRHLLSRKIHLFNSKATQWGCDHEKIALQQYCGLMSQTREFFIRDSGLILHHDMPFFGATPDGIVSCDCCGDGIAEMKCPFCQRNAAIIDAANDGKFCLAPTADGELKLKATHQYYQVQMQICFAKKTSVTLLCGQRMTSTWRG